MDHPACDREVESGGAYARQEEDPACRVCVELPHDLFASFDGDLARQHERFNAVEPQRLEEGRAVSWLERASEKLRELTPTSASVIIVNS